MLLLGQVSPTERTESSPEEKRLGDTGGQEAGHDLAIGAGSSVVSWAASKALWAAGEGGNSSPLLCSGETHLELCVQLWSPQHRRDMELLVKDKSIFDPAFWEWLSERFVRLTGN